jgi:glycolate oxidase iron-sulfur subunit
MQTELSAEYANSTIGKEAEAILRKCVHCGFCNATCPTYQLLGDELDGPRGRIYLIKQMFEGEQPNRNIELHLDRCLTCRSCETTCPSGVEYGKLLELGREVLDHNHSRRSVDRWLRSIILTVVVNRFLFSALFWLGNLIKPILPKALKSKLPALSGSIKQSWPEQVHQRKMVVLAGCVQRSIGPGTNVAAAAVLDRVGISLIEAPAAGCCGSVDLHTTSQARAITRAKALIDTWLPYLDRGIEGFVMTASGCGVTVKEYPNLFRGDPEYLAKSKRISENTYDLSEILSAEIGPDYQVENASLKVAFHAPCTLQHGQKLIGVVEDILQRVGYKLCEIENAHLCCGSAGTYSLLQPEISEQLRQEKLISLRRGNPDVICTANIGCQSHLNTDSQLPVKHWVELLL